MMDNETLSAVKIIITNSNAKCQLVKPNNHCVNAAERAIHTFKNHFISGLSSVNQTFPMYLWDELLPQAELSLNLLRSSRTYPKLSDHAHLHSIFSYNVTPVAPPGIQAILYKDPTHRTTNGLHGINVYYLGPALEHNRCYIFFVPTTGGTAISATAQLLPH